MTTSCIKKAAREVCEARGKQRQEGEETNREWYKKVKEAKLVVTTTKIVVLEQL